MAMASALAADTDYVERHTTNLRMLSVCNGLREAYRTIAALERDLAEARVANVRAEEAVMLDALVKLPPKVISQHCPVCINRRGSVARATKRWRTKKSAQDGAGDEASPPKN